MTRMLFSVGALSLLWAGCGGAGDEAAPGAVVDQVVGQAPPTVDGVPSVILLDPIGAETGRALTEEPIVMDQVGMAFAPIVLVVPPGQTLEFRNSEGVAHNVQVRRMTTDSTLFNVATEPGASYRHVLEETGGYDVICGIHPGMWASIVVDGARYHAVAQDDGSFTLEGVPPGTYTVRVWSQDAALRSERRVEVRPGRTELALEAQP